MVARGVLPIAIGEANSLDGLAIEQVKSVAAKYLSIEQIREIARLTEAEPGSLILVMAGNSDAIGEILGKLRLEMGYRLKLADPNTLAFCFVVDFPLFYRDEENNRWDSMHHPFTQAQASDREVPGYRPRPVHGRHYDMVCNGFEIGGGQYQNSRSRYAAGSLSSPGLQ